MSSHGPVTLLRNANETSDGQRETEKVRVVVAVDNDPIERKQQDSSSGHDIVECVRRDVGGPASRTMTLST